VKPSVARQDRMPFAASLAPGDSAGDARTGFMRIARDGRQRHGEPPSKVFFWLDTVPATPYMPASTAAARRDAPAAPPGGTWNRCVLSVDAVDGVEHRGLDDRSDAGHH